jgi:hypothetical protein
MLDQKHQLDTKKSAGIPSGCVSSETLPGGVASLGHRLQALISGMKKSKISSQDQSEIPV